MRTNNNFIHVSGTVVNLPDTVKYIPEPLIAFDLECHRRPTEKRPEPKPDVFRMVLMNDEEFIDTFQDGDRMEFKGEILPSTIKR